VSADDPLGRGDSGTTNGAVEFTELRNGKIDGGLHGRIARDVRFLKAHALRDGRRRSLTRLVHVADDDVRARPRKFTNGCGAQPGGSAADKKSTTFQLHWPKIAQRIGAEQA